MNYANLIQNITENIKTNGSQAITAQVLQDVLVDMVGELGQSGALLGGVIDTSFVPDPTNDAQVVYIAESPGTYTNFNGLVVGAGEVAFFYFDGNAWAKSSVDVLEVVNDLNSTATDKALSAAMGKQLQDSLTQAVNDLTTAIGNKADRQTTEQALNTLQNQINDKADTTYVNSQLATKADTASVNAALANKADTSYVNTQLATKADATATSTALAGKADKVAGAEVGNVAAFDAIGGIEDSGVAADNIAEQDGYYETMVVGGAENLIGSDIVSSQFIRRKTGGSTDVGTGVAILKTIKGNTLVWNQLIDFRQSSTRWINNGSMTTTWTDGAMTISNASTSATYKGQDFELITGHEYLQIVDAVCTLGANPGTVPQVSWNVNLQSWARTIGTTRSVLTNVITATATGTNRLQLRLRATDTSITVYSIRLFDLTQMFGAGNEPSTAAEFEAMFPLNNYAYNTGSLLNLTATGLQTNGWNQWDEEWEAGAISSSNGSNVPSSSDIRTKNYIPLIAGETYYFKSPIGVNTRYYDASKTFLSSLNGIINPGSSFTTPAGAAYLRFWGSATTYNNNICINKSDANKNGTYEPYWSETKVLPITTMTGKVNGQGESVVMLPDGARKAGNAFDETDGIKTWDRVGKFVFSSDLIVTVNAAGTANERVYVYYSGGQKVPSANNIVANLTSNMYQAASNDQTYSHTSDKIVSVVADRFLIYDSALIGKTVDQIKTALEGLEINYERATPIEYVNDTPLNLQYRVDNDGTETILPENTSTPTTSPIVADINYALNAIDTIRNLPQNYISKASMDAILTAFKTAGVITNYTLTWDATNQKYNCTITA